MPLVNAKCPNCGATLKTDDSKDAAICEFCNSAFIVERAINNFNTTINIANAQILVSDVDINNLIARAEQFKNAGDFNKASEYYNRVLDIDIKTWTELKEETRPYRDVVADAIYCKYKTKNKMENIYVNLDDALVKYEKDFFKKYKDEISQAIGSNIKWGEYRKNDRIHSIYQRTDRSAGRPVFRLLCGSF